MKKDAGYIEIKESRPLNSPTNSPNEIETYESKTKLLISEIKSLIKSAFPIAGSLMLMNSVAMASLFSLGHFGTFFLAASALSNMYCTITGFAVVLGLSTAMSTLGSQSFTSSSNKHTVGHHLQRVLLVQFMFAIPITYLWLKTEPILIFFGQDPEISYLSGVFAKCLIPGLIPFMISTCVTKYLQAQGIMNAGFVVLAIASPINIFLQLFLVFNTSLGGIGAPIATSITYIIIPMMLIPYATHVGGFNKCWGGFDSKEMFNARKIKGVLALGLPGILLICSESWAFEVMALIAGVFGQEKLAAQTTMLSACSLLYLFPLGFGTAATNRIGNLLGENNFETATLVANATVMFGCFLGLFNCLFLLSVKDLWGVFFTDDPLVLAHVAKLLPLVAFYQISDGIKAVASGVLQGCGLQRWGAIINIIGYASTNELLCRRLANWYIPYLLL
jgi:MATE family multidrug resistance protein